MALPDSSRNLPGWIIYVFFFTKTVENAFQIIIYKMMFTFSRSKMAVTLRKMSWLTPHSRPWGRVPGVSSDWNDVLMNSHSQWHSTRNQLTTVITSLPFCALKCEVHECWVVVIVELFFFSGMTTLSAVKNFQSFIMFPLSFGCCSIKELLKRVIFITTQIMVHVH